MGFIDEGETRFDTIVFGRSANMPLPMRMSLNAADARRPHFIADMFIRALVRRRCLASMTYF